MREKVTVAGCDLEAMGRLLAMIDDVVVVADLHGRIAGCSRGARQLLEVPANDLLGLEVAEIYVEDERSAHRERCRNVALGVSPSSFEGTIQTRHGALSARIELSLQRNQSREPAWLLSIVHVSTGAEGFLQGSGLQLRTLWSLIERVPVGVWSLDANRRFVFSNRAALALLADEQIDVTGRHVRDVLGEELHQKLLSSLDSVLSGSEAVQEVTARSKDGTDRHLVVYLLPSPGPGRAAEGCMAAVLDATRCRLLQDEQLRREKLLRATLIREINHRVKNSLQGLIGMLRLQASRGAPAKEVIEQGVAQLMAVAVAFGLASRHGEAQILLCDLVADIANNIGQISQRRIQVHLSPAAVREPVVVSERFGANISLVINELVFNAIKHSSNAEGHRGVSVFVDRKEDLAELRVVNESGRLPEAFSLESGSGLGTGLSLIKVLVPPECGALTISQDPQGVCARLELRQPVLSEGLA